MCEITQIYENTFSAKIIYFCRTESVQKRNQNGLLAKVTLIEFRKLISFRDGKTHFLFFREKNFLKYFFQKSIFRTSSETFKSGDFFENSVRRGLQLRSDQRVSLIECLPYLLGKCSVWTNPVTSL